MCQAGTVMRPILQMRKLRLELGSPLHKDTQPVSKWHGQKLSLGVLACPCQAPVRCCHTRCSRTADRSQTAWVQILPPLFIG